MINSKNVTIGEAIDTREMAERETNVDLENQKLLLCWL